MTWLIILLDLVTILAILALTWNLIKRVEALERRTQQQGIDQANALSGCHVCDAGMDRRLRWLERVAHLPGAPLR